MSKRPTPLRKPWYIKAQYYIDEYQHSWEGWFGFFTQWPIHMRLSELLGKDGEKVDAVRAEIALYDRRFFLSRWLRRPFSNVEYKRSRLYCYEITKEIKALVPFGVAESEAKAALNALLCRRAAQKSEGLRQWDRPVTDEAIAISRQRHTEASKMLVQAVSKAIVSVNVRYKQVSWFSGMHTALKKLGKLLSKTSKAQVETLKKRGVDVSGLDMGTVVATPAATTIAAMLRPQPVTAGTTSKGAPQLAAEQEPSADNQLALVPMSPSSVTNTASYWSSHSTHKSTAATANIEPLPEITALVEAAKLRPRATNVADLQQQFNDDKKRLKAIFTKIGREASQQGAEWLEFQLNRSHKAINSLLQRSYHTDKTGEDKECFKRATELTQKLLSKRNAEINKLRAGGGPSWVDEVVDKWMRQFDERAGELSQGFQRIRESNRHLGEAVQQYGEDVRVLRRGYAVLDEKLVANGKQIEATHQWFYGEMEKSKQQIALAQEQLAQTRKMVDSGAFSQPPALTADQRRELELIQQRVAQTTTPVNM